MKFRFISSKFHLTPERITSDILYLPTSYISFFNHLLAEAYFIEKTEAIWHRPIIPDLSINLLPAFHWMEESSKKSCSQKKKSFSQTYILKYPMSFSLLSAYSHTITCQYDIFHFICFVFCFPIRYKLFKNRPLSCLLLYQRTWHLIFIYWMGKGLKS